ncbi:MAG: insulinase family protein [Nanoarchaeota archaeon]|nr:insulinase family protein [Nanoarchaeota archaeon]MBU1621950.1 insulinase family protein [Nanoarchaeota archaeon]
MQKATLSNGLKIIYEKKERQSVVVEVMIKVGSNDENVHERGLSHFLEHMLFEGTKSKPTNRAITNEIEKIGGDFNAYTTNERTCFYIKVLKKHYSKAVNILADILKNSLFKESDVAKEKNIVLREIDLVNDEPSYYQWILLQKNLFKNHPCRNPTYGDKKVIDNLTREKVVNYFNHYYIPNNMVISVVGNIPQWKKEIEKQFILEKKPNIKRQSVKEPTASKNVIKKEKKKISSTYTILGFKTVPRTSPDIYPLEVINSFLGRGQSGRIFTELRSKRGLAYDVGSQNISEATFGYFAVYATIKKKNIKLVKKLILNELEKLQQLTEKDLLEAKNYIEGNYLLELEDTQKLADQLLAWEMVKDAQLMHNYTKKIKQVSLNDVKRVAKKYFQKHTMIVLEGK